MYANLVNQAMSNCLKKRESQKSFTYPYNVGCVHALNRSQVTVKKIHKSISSKCCSFGLSSKKLDKIYHDFHRNINPHNFDDNKCFLSSKSTQNDF